MKIFIAVDSILGGAGNVAQILAEYYSNRGDNVFLYLRHKRVDSRHDISQVTIVGEKGFLSLRTFHKEVIYLNKLINSISPDIIISFLSTVSPQILFSQWFTKVPIIVSERSNPFTDIPKKRYKIIRDISYRRADMVTVQFDHFKHFNKSAFEKGKVKVVPNMIMPPSILKNYSKKKGIITFTTFATLYSVKRIDLMINLFSKIHSIAPNTCLNIYGSGKNENDLKELVKDLSISSAESFKGHVSNVYECLSESDIYLMTSLREGFPNALSEAMAVGLPSIAIKCHEGLAELIQDGKNGFLIEEGNEDRFVEVAMTLIEDESLRESIGIRAAKSTEKYNYNKIVSIWNECISELLVN